MAIVKGLNKYMYSSLCINCLHRLNNNALPQLISNNYHVFAAFGEGKLNDKIN
jgi:hypothetical protein